MIQYDHRHIRENKITGYTKIEIKTTVKAGKKYFLETNLNLDKEQRVFSEKETWYDADTGFPLRYSEIDHRTGISITNQISRQQIITRVNDGGDYLEISLDMEPGLVPFEVLVPYLQQSLAKLMEEKEIQFILYLPVIAIEMKRKGLPTSFSKIDMAASIDAELNVESPLGRKKAIRVRLNPTSLLMNTILPTERTAFFFTFTVDPPHILLAFQENQTVSSLSEFRP